MEARRFDTVVKAFAGGTNRRQVLQGVRAAVAAALGVTLGLEVTEAARRKKRKAKVKAQRGKPAGRRGCGCGETRCGRTCANTQTDPAHCGNCDTSCSGATPICCGGTCVASSCPTCQACGPNGCELHSWCYAAFHQPRPDLCGRDEDAIGCLCGVTTEGTSVCVRSNILCNAPSCTSTGDCTAPDTVCVEWKKGLNDPCDPPCHCGDPAETVRRCMSTQCRLGS
jgi:hypothetical protein